MKRRTAKNCIIRYLPASLTLRDEGPRGQDRPAAPKRQRGEQSRILPHLAVEWVFFLAALLCGFSLPTWSADLDAVVNRLQETYQGIDDWKATFDQSTYVELLKREVRKGGKILIKKPSKWRIEYGEATGKQYISNGKEFWIYSPADEQVITHRNLSKVLAREALVFLSGLGNLRRDFSIAWYAPEGTGEEPPKGAPSGPPVENAHLLQLTPKKGQSPVSKIVLAIDRYNSRVKEATVFNTSGNVTRYAFKNIVINSGLGDGLFSFRRPEGVTVVKGD